MTYFFDIADRHIQQYWYTVLWQRFLTKFSIFRCSSLTFTIDPRNMTLYFLRTSTFIELDHRSSIQYEYDPNHTVLICLCIMSIDMLGRSVHGCFARSTCWCLLSRLKVSLSKMESLRWISSVRGSLRIFVGVMRGCKYYYLLQHLLGIALRCRLECVTALFTLSFEVAWRLWLNVGDNHIEYEQRCVVWWECKH
jgi:hypothetical protein